MTCNWTSLRQEFEERCKTPDCGTCRHNPAKPKDEYYPCAGCAKHSEYEKADFHNWYLWTTDRRTRFQMELEMGVLRMKLREEWQ